MKKIILVITCCVLLVVIAIGGISLYFGGNPAPSRIAALNIEGKTIEGMAIEIDNYGVDLPFIEMLKAFGADIDWLNDDVAKIIYDEKEYTLNLPELSFIGEDKAADYYMNIFKLPASRGPYRYEVLDKEIMFDISSIRMFMYAMDIDFDMKTDYHNLIVYITKAAPPQIGTLNIEGKTIEGMSIKIYKHDVELPFVEMLKAFGADVDWVDKNVAKINCNGKEYTLNLLEFSFMGECDGEYEDMLEFLERREVYRYTVLDKEIMFESYLIEMFMYEMETSFDMDIDRENLIVYVTKAENKY